jgi:hypothetical protein
MNERHDGETAIEAFENEGGALHDGPQIRSSSGRHLQVAISDRHKLLVSQTLSNPYTIGLVTAIVCDIIHEMLAMLF